MTQEKTCFERIDILQDNAVRCLSELMPKIEKTFRDMEITIQYRVKTKESILKKCKLKNLLAEKLTDILGIRVIGKTKDFDIILNKIFENFEVKELEDFWFHTTELGYRSFHVLIDVNGFTVEMQIHTAVSSAFALLCHNFYKNNKNNCCTQEVLTELKKSLEKEAERVNCNHLSILQFKTEAV